MDSNHIQGVRLCLTVDVESDYGRADTYEVLNRAAPFFEWIQKDHIPITAFVVGRLFQQGHPIIETLLKAGASLGVHGFSHSPDTFSSMQSSHADEIQKGVEAFERRVGRKPSGYRAPAGVISRDDVLLLNRLGLRYDASVFPMRRLHRYDFSGLPEFPFRWEGTSLVEVPVGMLTSTLPAGMSFVNLFGARLSAYLVRNRLVKLKEHELACHVTDIHLHNLFAYHPAMVCLPFSLRIVYLAGSLAGGLSMLVKYVSVLRRGGYTFCNLEDNALSLKVESLPVVGLDCFDRKIRSEKM